MSLVHWGFYLMYLCLTQDHKTYSCILLSFIALVLKVYDPFQLNLMWEQQKNRCKIEIQYLGADHSHFPWTAQINPAMTNWDVAFCPILGIWVWGKGYPRVLQQSLSSIILLLPPSSSQLTSTPYICSDSDHFKGNQVTIFYHVKLFSKEV